MKKIRLRVKKVKLLVIIEKMVSFFTPHHSKHSRGGAENANWNN